MNDKGSRPAIVCYDGATIQDELLSWHQYKERAREFSGRSRAIRARLAFRGQADARWPLRASLDRVRAFPGDEEREAFLAGLLTEFWREAAGLHKHRVPSPTSTQAEMIARHHGVPTALLDWTRSPYVAAYSAFDSARAEAEHVAVWLLDRGVFLEREAAAVSIGEEPSLRTRNVRAIEQQGLFTRLNSADRDLERLIGPGLGRIRISVHERRTVLSDLDLMNINARTLFRDLDGAARSVVRRLVDYGEVTP